MTTLSNDWPMQVFYDGACPLCSREMGIYRRRDSKNRIQFIDIAGANFDAATYGLDPAAIQQAMHVRMADGRIYTAVRAFLRIWEAIPSFWTKVLRLILKVPGMMFLAGIFYRLFAKNRYRLTGRCTPESCSIEGR